MIFDDCITVFLPQFEGLDTTIGNCHTDEFRVWDIEAHEDTALALVIGHAHFQKSSNIPWVALSILLFYVEVLWGHDTFLLMKLRTIYSEKYQNLSKPLNIDFKYIALPTTFWSL